MLTKTFLVNTARIYGLSREQEEVFLLTILENLSRRHIADELGISSDAISKRLGGVYEKFQIPGKGRGKEAKLRKLLMDELRGSKDVSEQQHKAPARIEAASGIGPIHPQVSSHPLVKPLHEWFDCLGYEFEQQSFLSDDCFEWMIRIKVRRGYDRIIVHGVQGEVSITHIQALRQSVDENGTDEGWVVALRRISQIARRQSEQSENDDLFCYTFDELIEQDVNFDRYFDWVDETVRDKGIASNYIDLACRKPEVLADTSNQEIIDYSFYGEQQGWIDGYVDLWLDDPAKEHLSILGEFGTGKTWFALHYTWIALQRYKYAKIRGLERPRIPLLIPLRECARAASLQSILLDFFFNKHKISISDYAIFEQLNRMGKLLLIFDGFDEMADRINHQSMVNNFWELARVVMSGSKAILTCRTEHFPDAKAGRALLKAELKASTAELTGETPQFEVLELEAFDDTQIQQVLELKASAVITKKFMNQPRLLSLARRPLMIELILDALPEIKAEKTIDIARIYLYAIRSKLEKDIKSARTFTSLADKLYFLCELSWEMLSTEQIQISYKHFPARIRQFFGNVVESEIELDHWHYDMMGQTMLIRNEYGEYTPAHRSFLEFFVAYKLTAALGCLASDFVEIARQKSSIDEKKTPKFYSWSNYFSRERTEVGKVVPTAPLKTFREEKKGHLYDLLNHAILPKAILELMAPMLAPSQEGSSVRTQLIDFLSNLKNQKNIKSNYLAGNIINLLLKRDISSLQGCDLSHMTIKGADFTQANLRDTNFSESLLENCLFPQDWGGDLSVAFSSNGRFIAIVDSDGFISLWDVQKGAQVWEKKGHIDWIRAVTFDMNSQILATGSHDKTIKLWDMKTGKLIRVLKNESRVYSLSFSSDSHLLVSGGDEKVVKLWDLRYEAQESPHALGHHETWIGTVSFGQSESGEILVTGSDDGTIKVWDPREWRCIQTLNTKGTSIQSVAIVPGSQLLVSGGTDKCVSIWDIQSGKCLHKLQGHTDWIRSVSVSPNRKLIASAGNDKTIKIWDIKTGQCKRTIDAHMARVWSIAFSPDQSMLASGSDDRTVKLWNPQTGECLQTLLGNSQGLWSIVLSSSPQKLFCGSDDHRVQSWDVQSQQNRESFQGHRGRVRAVALLEQSQLLASGSDDKTIKLWNIKTGDCLKTLEGHKDWVWSVAFSPDARFLASGSLDETIMLWDMDMKQHVRTFSEHSKFVWSIAWSSTSDLLASGSADCTIKLWSPVTGDCHQTLCGHKHQVTSITFAPISQRNVERLASGSDDETVKIWTVKARDLKTEAYLETTLEHGVQVRAIAFNSDASLLASAGLDGMIKLWDIQDINAVKLIQEIDAHTKSIVALKFASNHQLFATGGETGTIQLFDVKTGNCTKRFISDNSYQGMDITNVQGLKSEQEAMLLALGATCKNSDSKDSTKIQSG